MKTFHEGRSPWQSFFEKQTSWKNFKFCNLIHLHIYESETVMFYGKPHWMLKNTANVCLFWYMNFDFLIFCFSSECLIHFFKIVVLSVENIWEMISKVYSDPCQTLKLSFPAGIYLLKVDNRNTKTRCEICSKITKKTRKRRHGSHSGVFIVKFEHNSHLVLVLLLLTLNM